MVRYKQFCLPPKYAAVPEMIRTENNKVPRKMQLFTSAILQGVPKMTL